jgi:hypothetical protein
MEVIMKIIRDGKEFELTFSEVMKAHEEYELDCMVLDVKSVLESDTRDVELSEDKIKEVAMSALHNLGKNDSYFEAYWTSVEYTLNNYINNILGSRED